MATEKPLSKFFDSETLVFGLSSDEKGSPTISFRLPKQYFDEVERLANENGISRSAVVRLMVINQFKQIYQNALFE